MWQSNPTLAVLDGLNDYDEDYTDAALAVEVLQTAYKVGRGFLTDDDIDSGDQEDAPREDDEETQKVADAADEERPEGDTEAGSDDDNNGNKGLDQPSRGVAS